MRPPAACVVQGGVWAGQRRKVMAMRISKHRWLLLVGALVAAAALMAVACGEEKEKETAETPGASPAATQPTGEKVPGVTDTEILLGTHFPLSGVAAPYAAIVEGISAYFDYINSQGGVYGRKIKLIIGDDQYNPANTVEVVRKLVEQDNVFAIAYGLGESTHLAVYKYLEERGVPDLFVGSGIRVFTEPLVRSRFGANPNYYTEGMMLGQYIAENYPGKKLGLLVQNDELGADGEAGIRKALEGSDVEIVARETYEGVEFDVTAQTQRLKGANPDVVVGYAIPPQAASLIKVSREVLNWNVPILISGVSVTDVTIQLAGAQNAEGVVSVVFGKQVYQTDDPAIQRHLQIMKDFGQGVEVSNFTMYGQNLGELMVKTLENAGPNLTRESVIEGAEAIRDWCCTACLVPMNMSPTDHRPIEMELYTEVKGGKWVPISEPISFESTPGKVIGCKGMGEPVYASEGG
jgi:branched-chain amino acid transport system substrate-binding protein